MNKKLLKFTTSIVLSGLFAFTMNAQCALSGTYTINADLPADRVNFTSFTTAVTELNNCGVSGPVVINVAGGDYNEQISIDSIAGASGSNTITIQADPSSRVPVKLTYTAIGELDNYVIRFSNASHVTVKGITASSGDTTYQRVVEFAGSGEHIVLKGNTFKAINPASSDIGRDIAIINSSDPFNYAYDYTLIEENIILGDIGVVLQASGSGDNVFGNVVRENNIRGGLRTRSHDSLIVEYNQVFDNFMSIEGGAYCMVRSNKVIYSDNSSSVAASGINVFNYDSSTVHNRPNLVANNVILIAGTHTAFRITGLEIIESNKIDVVHNTVYNRAAGGLQVTGIYIRSGSHVRVLNNNVFTTGTGTAFDIEGNFENIDAMDYNNLYANGLPVVRYGDLSSSATTLSDWQAVSSFDSNSVSMDPQFMSSADLRVFISAMDDLGVPYAGISTDIEGNTRSATSPDIGAYEFTAYTDDLFVTELLAPVDGACGDSNTTVSLVVFNRGANDASGFSVGAIIEGQGISMIYNDTLHSGEGDTVNIFGFNTIEGEMVEIQSYTSLSSDVNMANDTLYSSVYVQSAVNPQPVSSKGFFCADEPYDTLYFPLGSVSAFEWKTTEGSSLGVSNGLVVGPLNNADTSFVLVPLENTCNSSGSIISLEYIASPEAGFSSTLQGPTETDFTVSFDADTSENANTYNWDFGDGNTATGDSVSNVYTSDGSYNVQLIVTGECGSDTLVKTVEIQGISLKEDILSQTLEVYPNPVNDLLNISFEAEKNGRVELLDLSGKTIVIQSFTRENGLYKTGIDVSKLAHGVYLLRIESGDMNAVKRIIRD